MFRGARHCSHCGALARRAEQETTARKCPRCRVELGRVRVGDTEFQDCANCAGLWLGKDSFDHVCADLEQQAAVLGFGAAKINPVAAQKVSYVPCPDCGQLMNRMNFARYSGVIVDVCREHGTWFDADELRRVVEFIRRGGLDQARSREKEKLAAERRALEQERLIATRRDSFHGRNNAVGYEERQLLMAELACGIIGFLVE
jgi:Zn-finger nucleic acid-binding protein